MTEWRPPATGGHPIEATIEEVTALAQYALDLVDRSANDIRSSTRGVGGPNRRAVLDELERFARDPGGDSVIESRAARCLLGATIQAPDHSDGPATESAAAEIARRIISEVRRAVDALVTRSAEMEVVDVDLAGSYIHHLPEVAEEVESNRRAAAFSLIMLTSHRLLDAAG